MKGELDCFNFKTRVSVLRLFTSMFTKRKQLKSTVLGKNQLLHGEYSGALKEELLETSYNELEIYQD